MLSKTLELASGFSPTGELFLSELREFESSIRRDYEGHMVTDVMRRVETPEMQAKHPNLQLRILDVLKLRASLDPGQKTAPIERFLEAANSLSVKIIATQSFRKSADRAEFAKTLNGSIFGCCFLSKFVRADPISFSSLATAHAWPTCLENGPRREGTFQRRKCRRSRTRSTTGGVVTKIKAVLASDYENADDQPEPIVVDEEEESPARRQDRAKVFVWGPSPRLFGKETRTKFSFGGPRT